MQKKKPNKKEPSDVCCEKIVEIFYYNKNSDSPSELWAELFGHIFIFIFVGFLSETAYQIWIGLPKNLSKQLKRIT